MADSFANPRALIYSLSVVSWLHSASIAFVHFKRRNDPTLDSSAALHAHLHRYIGCVHDALPLGGSTSIVEPSTTCCGILFRYVERI